jgi:hypothetical protein
MLKFKDFRFKQDKIFVALINQFSRIYHKQIIRERKFRNRMFNSEVPFILGQALSVSYVQ